VAILGALWQSAEPLKEFLKINEKCQKQGQLL
jgi:hypothetical protein